MLGFADSMDLSIVNCHKNITKGLFTRSMNGSDTILDYAFVDSSKLSIVKSLVIDAVGCYF